MENGDSLYARIAELEKENKELQEEINLIIQRIREHERLTAALFEED